MSAAGAFDKLYWLRIGLGVVSGYLANWVFSPTLDYVDGILLAVIIYLGSYYFARYVWYRSLNRENFSKLYTTGIGGFIMLFLLTWILLFTLAR